ncbi:hypothetical protein [Pseudomonas sp. DP16D-R1]|jgi:hypothetical protein|uniref:hypothetical protein n=1 Tax=Pseudomonas sp. DP16D-R1 TaxID=2075551 RepID=UPI000CD2F379|nr:hypothetical protein [Pseudomonas sp. DP16D-R1]POA78640.1 hypothetical protein C1890_09905 [Pseudomonas sp. DP16D-R1]
MKRPLLLLPLMLAMLAGCSKPVPTETGPEPGTAAAAKELAPNFLLQMFTVVDEPVIDGDTATVNAVILNQKCVLTMQRTNETPYGWLVSKQSCVATNLSTQGANSPFVTGKGAQVVIHAQR